MKISVINLQLAIGKYFKDEILPIVKDPLKKFIVGGTITAFTLKGESLISKYLPMLQSIGAVDDNGLIDIDILKTFMLGGLEANNGSIIFADIKFNKEDIEKFIDLLEKI